MYGLYNVVQNHINRNSVLDSLNPLFSQYELKLDYPSSLLSLMLNGDGWVVVKGDYRHVNESRFTDLLEIDTKNTLVRIKKDDLKQKLRFYEFSEWIIDEKLCPWIEERIRERTKQTFGYTRKTLFLIHLYFLSRGTIQLSYDNDTGDIIMPLFPVEHAKLFLARNH